MNEPGQNEGRRGERANARIGRNETDQHRSRRHQHDGQYQRHPASISVANPADDDCAERTGQESDTECGERREEGCDFVTIRKEYAGDRRGKKAVDDKVVPFERVADHGSANDTTQLTALCCRHLDSQGYAPSHCFGLENNARYGRIDAQNLCIAWRAARRLRTGGMLDIPAMEPRAFCEVAHGVRRRLETRLRSFR